MPYQYTKKYPITLLFFPHYDRLSIVSMILVHLKHYRTEAGLTQEALADMCSVSRQTIISLEKGTYQPSLDLAFTLAYHLHISIVDLCEYTL